MITVLTALTLSLNLTLWKRLYATKQIANLSFVINTGSITSRKLSLPTQARLNRWSIFQRSIILRTSLALSWLFIYHLLPAPVKPLLSYALFSILTCLTKPSLTMLNPSPTAAMSLILNTKEQSAQDRPAMKLISKS